MTYHPYYFVLHILLFSTYLQKRNKMGLAYFSNLQMQQTKIWRRITWCSHQEYWFKTCDNIKLAWFSKLSQTHFQWIFLNKPGKRLFTLKYGNWYIFYKTGLLIICYLKIANVYHITELFLYSLAINALKWCVFPNGSLVINLQLIEILVWDYLQFKT